MTADNRADLRLNGSAKSNVCRALTLPWKQTSFPIVQKCICFMFILYLSFYVVLFCSDGFQTPTLTDNIHAIQTVSKLQHRQTTFTLFRRFKLKLLLQYFGLPSTQTSQWYMKHAVTLMQFPFCEICFVIELSNIKLHILITAGCSSYLNQF